MADRQMLDDGDSRFTAPIREDAAVDISDNTETGKPEIDLVKPIFRPPEKITEPVKPNWKWIWLAVIVLVVLAWLLLFWHFGNHHAPSSAPL